MTSQLSFVHAQAHQQELSMAAEHAHHAASLERRSVLSTGWQRTKRFRWTSRAPKAAPAAHARVTVA